MSQDVDYPPPHVKAGVRLQALRAQIVDMILDSGLQPGDAIPTETELMARFGVGRNTLREALKALQAVGVVEVRHGYRTLVGSGRPDALVEGLTFRGRLSLRHDREEARELVQVREAFEAGLLPRAMELIRPDDLTRVRDTVRLMEARAIKDGRFADLDSQFHRQLFAPLGNALLSELLEAFWTANQLVRHDLGEDPVDPRVTAASHRAIYEAVASGDASAAVTAMRHHFRGINERLATSADKPS